MIIAESFYFILVELINFIFISLRDNCVFGKITRVTCRRGQAYPIDIVCFCRKMATEIN